MRLRAGPALAEIDPEHGGRLASLVVDGLPVLFGARSAALQWGAYPMVPWAGRVADGRFTFAGRDHQLPINLPPHSAHGIGFVSAWTVTSRSAWAAELTLDLDARWPFGGRVDQHVELTSASLTLGLTVTASAPMPVMVGWHPWFNRFIGRPGGGVAEVELDVVARSMYELDDRAIPTGRLVPPPPGPWDNCFTDLDRGPTLGWPGLLDLRLTSSCDHWVIYDRPGHAVCVEPQSDAPDAFNREQTVLEAGRSLEEWFRLEWS